MEVFAAAAKAVQGGKPVAMATVIHASGSTPRNQGARMLVYADGHIVGSEGGGALEKKVIDLALQAIKTHTHTRYNSRLDVEKGMRCAGNMEIYIEPLNICTPLYIFGAGHVARAVASILSNLHFGVSVIDDREALLTVERFPSASLYRTSPFAFAEGIESTEQSHFILMTHLHERDCELARILIQKPHRWLGVLGSVRKIRLIKEELSIHGISEERISEMHAPIGLDIGAQNPHEIAISVVAQLIAHRSNVEFPIHAKSNFINK